MIFQLNFLSISKCGSHLISSSTFMVPKGVKGRPTAARRSTVDDQSSVMSCADNGQFPKTAKISSGEKSLAETDFPKQTSATFLIVARIPG